MPRLSLALWAALGFFAMRAHAAGSSVAEAGAPKILPLSAALAGTASSSPTPLRPLAEELSPLPSWAPAVTAQSVQAEAPQAAAEAAPAAANFLVDFKKSQARQSKEGGGGDISGTLSRLYDNVKSGNAGPLPDEAKGVRYLFVPGLSWDIAPDYFEPNLKRMRELGLEAEIVKTDPFGTAKTNVEIIAKAIKASEKPAALSGMPVVLIGHSRGGNDVLRTLTLKPELQAKILSVVALQSPIFGTPIADLALSKPLLGSLLFAASRLLNPSRLLSANPFIHGDTIAELSRARLAGASREKPFTDLGIAVYSVVSRLSGKSQARWLSWISAGLIKWTSGFDSDGVVTSEHAIVPGSRYAVIDDVAHHDIVLKENHWRRRLLGVKGQDIGLAGNMTEAIIRLIFSRSRKA